ncbi:MAG: histidine phosphatase family protein [Alphaproteobacteria bacterium]
MRPSSCSLSGLLLALTLLFSVPMAAMAADPWQAVRDGRAFAMIRHALAPGTGDPASFDVSDCSTQRNLDDAGRRQAERLGDIFRENGIAEADVFTSAWCRCRDTATLMDLGAVTVLPPLNSFFRNRSREAGQMRALKDWLAARQSSAPLVLVTHQVNITALTDVFPQSGEIIFVAGDPADGFRVIARVATDD